MPGIASTATMFVEEAITRSHGEQPIRVLLDRAGEVRGQLRLAAKAHQGVAGERAHAGEHLERDLALVLQVLGQEDQGHAAFSDLLPHLVEAQAAFVEDLGGEALLLAQQPEQQVDNEVGGHIIFSEIMNS